MMPELYLTTLPLTRTGLPLSSVALVTTSATVRALAPVALATLIGVVSTTLAAAAGMAAATGPAPPKLPKMMVGKVFLSDLLSKFFMTMEFSMVTLAPTLTGALLTA